MKKYSNIYPVKGEKYFGYRYNFTDAVLEYVSKWDYRKVDGEWKDVILEDWDVTSAVGLSREDWKENPRYWIDYYQCEINQETQYLLNYV